MKILVIDDTKTHLTAALQTLVGHDVTICSNHDEALSLLEEQHDTKEQTKRKEQYIAEGMSNWDAYKKSQEETRLPYWDAVLCDLLMPAGRNAQGGEGMKFIGQEMAVGWSLALVAAKQGAKFVAVVTDMNHHHHPASAMLDRLNHHFFKIDEAKVMMTNYVSLIGITGTEHICPECNGSGKKYRDDKSEYECYSCENGTTFAQHGKNWGEILNQLLKEKNEANE